MLGITNDLVRQHQAGWLEQKSHWILIAVGSYSLTRLRQARVFSLGIAVVASCSRQAFLIPAALAMSSTGRLMVTISELLAPVLFSWLKTRRGWG
jgi:hypothetical protein